MPPVRTVIAGVGAYLPARVVTNDELAEPVDTSDAWIQERTGIRQRHLAVPPPRPAPTWAPGPPQAALADAGATAADVDAIILATATPDQAFPATALRVQAALGIRRGFGFDVSAACSGFVYALSVADAHDPHRAGPRRPGDRQRGLFPHPELDRPRHLRPVRRRRRRRLPPAAARQRDGDRGILSTHLHADGTLGDILYVDGAVGPARQARPPRDERPRGLPPRRHKLAGVVDEALVANGLAQADVGLAGAAPGQPPHHRRHGPKLGLPPERVVVTVDRHANTSAASIPLALAEAYADGRIKRGDLVLMEALGGGLTWGSRSSAVAAARRRHSCGARQQSADCFRSALLDARRAAA